ncbi:hypothetical protein Acr_00g0000540 [Actinidia rufa]|uniref:Uncharacterized protein n=1 Tax=Actinidia rufa TaxID=165716 RepID=A0A7J0D6A0_9ERIC|nr:hypothetical protein Acr_00g0000540 [Actinidia rufa]
MSSVFPRRLPPSSELLSGLPLDMEPNERKLRQKSYDAVGCDVAWALPLLSSMPLVDLTLGIDLTFGSVRDAAGRHWLRLRSKKFCASLVATFAPSFVGKSICIDFMVVVKLRMLPLLLLRMLQVGDEVPGILPSVGNAGVSEAAAGSTLRDAGTGKDAGTSLAAASQAMDRPAKQQRPGADYSSRIVNVGLVWPLALAAAAGVARVSPRRFGFDPFGAYLPYKQGAKLLARGNDRGSANKASRRLGGPPSSNNYNN